MCMMSMHSSLIDVDNGYGSDNDDVVDYYFHLYDDVVDSMAP